MRAETTAAETASVLSTCAPKPKSTARGGPTRRSSFEGFAQVPGAPLVQPINRRSTSRRPAWSVPPDPCAGPVNGTGSEWFRDGQVSSSFVLVGAQGRPTFRGIRQPKDCYFYRQSGRDYGLWLRALPMELVTGEAVSARSENGHRTVVNLSGRPRDLHLSLRMGANHVCSWDRHLGSGRQRGVEGFGEWSLTLGPRSTTMFM
jgi:hypothetical protein